MFEIDSIRPEINKICQRLKVKRLDLFGSATGDMFGPESDVDVLVEFERETGQLFDRYFELKENLETLFNRPVDVVMAEAVRNPYFKIALEESKRCVYCAD